MLRLLWLGWWDQLAVLVGRIGKPERTPGFWLNGKSRTRGPIKMERIQNRSCFYAVGFVSQTSDLGRKSTLSITHPCQHCQTDRCAVKTNRQGPVVPGWYLAQGMAGGLTSTIPPAMHRPLRLMGWRKMRCVSKFIHADLGSHSLAPWRVSSGHQLNTAMTCCPSLNKKGQPLSPSQSSLPA